MSNRSGFFEGLIVGAILGGLSILIAAPNSRKELESKIKKLKDDNEDIIESTKETTEDLIEKTKKSIETGFDKLGSLIKDNQKINAEDIISSSKPKK